MNRHRLSCNPSFVFTPDLHVVHLHLIVARIVCCACSVDELRCRLHSRSVLSWCVVYVSLEATAVNKKQLTWWGKPDKNGRYSKLKESKQAWRVSIDDIRAGNFNLDLKNPHNSDESPGYINVLLPEYEALLQRIAESLSGNLRLRQVLNWRRLTARPIHFSRKGLRDDIRTDSS